jgi:hypothetical protein
MGLLNLTESERLEILNLHNNARIIKEQAAPTVPAAAGTPAAAPQTAADVIKELQTLLNTKYGAKLAVDGKWGNLTQTAFETALKSKSAAPAASTTTAAPAASTTTAAPAASTGTASPAASTTTAPAASTTTAPAASTTTAPAASTTTAPAASTTTAPAASTTTVPDEFGGEAPATPAAPLSNRDQRRQRQDLRRGNRRAMQDLRGQQRAQ